MYKKKKDKDELQTKGNKIYKKQVKSKEGVSIRKTGKKITTLMPQYTEKKRKGKDNSNIQSHKLEF